MHSATVCISQLLHQCSQTNNLVAIKKFHAHLLRNGLLSISVNLQTQLLFSYTSSLHHESQKNIQTLINYLKCLSLTDPSPFNSIISVLCRNGFHSFGLRTFSFMHSNAVTVDSYALCSSLIASSWVESYSPGKQIHALVVKSGWLSSVFVGSALIDSYAKLLNVDDAKAVFDEIPVKNTVCANALLSGYAESKRWVEGLELIRKMQELDLNCDNFTFSAALRSCIGLSAIEMGSQVHANVTRMIPDMAADVFIQSLLIELYGKCGALDKAWKVFSMEGLRGGGESKRDVVLWTTMLGAYGRNGNYKEVIALFDKMLMETIRPDGVAFVTVISACGHTGQVNLGIDYFESMTRDFKLNPSQEHYSCLVDMLCRAGELDKAWNLVNGMPCQGNKSGTVSMWGALLSACNESGNVEFGKLAAQRALELDPQNVGIYVLLSNVYARYGMWKEIGQLRELMKSRGLKKDIGSSWIEVTY